MLIFKIFKPIHALVTSHDFGTHHQDVHPCGHFGLTQPVWFLLELELGKFLTLWVLQPVSVAPPHAAARSLNEVQLEGVARGGRGVGEAQVVHLVGGGCVSPCARTYVGEAKGRREGMCQGRRCDEHMA